MSPLSLPDFTGVQAKDIMQVMQLCEQGRGEEVLEHFEKEFAHCVGTRFAVAVSSATSGLHLALLALGVGEGDSVICPTFTFAASAFPILYQNAQPVFVDSEKDTWNMSSLYLEEAISNGIKKGKKPKAIVLVHGYGTPADLKAIQLVAEHYSIPLIEDAANALGATWEGKQVGSFGKIGVFSFNRNKIISAGSGGVVVTNEEEIAKKARYFAHQAKSMAPYYQHEAVGYNYGISPILAEIVRVQLPTLSERVKKRRAAFMEQIHFFGEEVLFQKELKGIFSNRWLTVGMPSSSPISEWPLSKDWIRRVWKPMHIQPVFKEMTYFGNQESVHFFEKGFCLPFLQGVTSSIPFSI